MRSGETSARAAAIWGSGRGAFMFVACSCGEATASDAAIITPAIPANVPIRALIDTYRNLSILAASIT
jgi:hypothetical protein